VRDTIRRVPVERPRSKVRNMSKRPRAKDTRFLSKGKQISTLGQEILDDARPGAA
jgi:hypothetical protein